MNRRPADIAATLLNVVAFLTCRDVDAKARAYVEATHQPYDGEDERHA